MEYRAVRPEEHALLRRAEEYCFFIAPADYDPWVERFMQPEQTRAIFGDDGELKAGLINFPYTLYMDGARVPMGGIAGVVSWPETRREGHVGELLIRLMHEEKEKGVPLSSLYPFKQSFYRRFGWEVSAAWLRHEIPVDLLGRYRGSEGVVRRFAPGDADWRALAALYAARYANGLGYMVRETEQFWLDWVNPLWSRTGNVYHTALWQPARDAQPEGYMLYRFIKDEKGAQQLLVRELVALTPAAEHGLWGYVGQHDSQVGKVIYRTPRDYPLWHLAENTRDVQSQLQSGWMLRFVDIRAAFAARPWPSAPDCAFTIGVTDGHLPWNNGTFRLAFEAGHATMTPAPGETPVLAADQRTWAQLYAGFLRPDQALSNNSLSCLAPNALRNLAQALAGKEMWFYEFF